MTIYIHGKTSTAMRKRIEIPRMARDFGVLVDAHLGILLLLGMIIMTLSIIPMVIFAFSKKSSKKRDHNNRGARTMKAMTEKVVVRVDTKTKEAKMSQQHHVPKSNVPPTILPIYVPPPVLPNHNHKLTNIIITVTTVTITTTTTMPVVTIITTTLPAFTTTSPCTSTTRQSSFEYCTYVYMTINLWFFNFCKHTMLEILNKCILFLK